MSRLQFLLALLAALWPLAAWTIPPEAASLPPLRRIWLTDRSQLPPGDWTSVSRTEFERTWEAAEKAKRAAAPIDVHALRLRLRVQGDCLIGDGALDLSHRGTGPAAVNLEPWNLALMKRPALGGEPAVVGLPDGGPGLEILVKRPGRQTLVFDAGTRGSATPAGLQHQIDLPPIPLIELEVWLPPDLRPVALDARNEFFPVRDRDRSGFTGWRCSVGGSGPSRLTMRVQTETLAPSPSPVVAKVKSSYTLTPHGLEGQWNIEATGARPGTEWLWTLDEDWELVEVMEHTLRRPLTWRRLPPPLAHVVAVAVPPENERCSWRVRARPRSAHPQPPAPPEYRLGQFLPLQAHRCEETIALRLDRLLSLSSLNPGDFLVTAWNIADADEANALRRYELVGGRPPGPLPLLRPTIRAAQASAALTIVQEHWLHLEPAAAQLQVRLRVQAASGARQLQVRLPADWQLVDLRWVDGTGVSVPPIHASAQGDLLTLQSAVPWTQLEVQAQLRRPLELSEAKSTPLSLPAIEPLGARDFLAVWALTLARGGVGTEAAPLLTAQWTTAAPIWEAPRSGGPWRDIAAVPDFSWQTRQVHPASTLDLRLLPARFSGSVQTTLSQIGATGRLEYRLIAVPQTGESSTISLEFSEPAPAALAWRVAEGSNAIAAYRRPDDTHAEIVLARPVRGNLELQGEAEWPLDQPIPLLRWAFAPTAELWLRQSAPGQPEVPHAGWLGALPSAADGFQRWLYDRSTQKVRLMPKPALAAAEPGRTRSLPWGLLTWHWRGSRPITGRFCLPANGLEQLRFRLPEGHLLSAKADRTELSWEGGPDGYAIRFPRSTREVELMWQLPARGNLLARADLVRPEWSEALDFGDARETLWTDLPAPLLGSSWEAQEHSGAFGRPMSHESTTVWAMTWAGLITLMLVMSTVLGLACWAPRWLGLCLAGLVLGGGWWAALNLSGLGAALGAGLAALAGGGLAWRWPGQKEWASGQSWRSAAAVTVLLGLAVPAWGARDGKVFAVYILPGDDGKPDSSLVLVSAEEWQSLVRRTTPSPRSVWVCAAYESGTWNGEQVRVSSKVTVYVAGSVGRWPLRLSPGQRLARITVGGEARAPLLEAGQAWLELPGPGEHECEIHWEASAAASPKAMSTSLLEAPVHVLNLIVPDGAAWSLQPVTAVPITTHDGQAWHLPPSHEPWSLAGGPRRGEIRTRAIQEVMLTPEGRRLRSLWNVSSTGGILEEWSAWWPADWLIKTVEVSAASGRLAPPRLAQWRLEPIAADRSRLVLKLAEPVTGEFRILIEAESTTDPLAALLPSLDAVGVWGLAYAAAARGSFTQRFLLELPSASAGARDEDLLILRSERVNWSMENVGKPVPQPTLLRAAPASRQVYRFGPTDPMPSVQVGPISLAPAVQQNVQFHRRGTELTMEAELNVASTNPWATRLVITPPTGMKLTSVDGSRVAAWEPGPERHILWVAPGGDAGGDAVVRLRGWMLLESPEASVAADRLRAWCCEVGPGTVKTEVSWRETDAAVRDRAGSASIRQVVGCDGPTWRVASEVHFATPAAGPLQLEVRHWPEGAALKWEANQPLSVMAEPAGAGQWRVRLASSEPLAWFRLLGAWPAGAGGPVTVPQLRLVDQSLPTKIELGAGVVQVSAEGPNAPPQVRWQVPDAAEASAQRGTDQPLVGSGGSATPNTLGRVGMGGWLYLIPCPALLVLVLRWWRARLVPAAPAS